MGHPIYPSMLIAVVSAIIAYAWGYSDGMERIYRADHIQARAGVFIDGHDKNKIYRVTPVEPQP